MLSPSQLEEFDRWGLLRLPAALPQSETAQMQDLVWEQLAREHGIERDRPDTWTVERPQGFKAISRSETFSRTGVGPIAEAAEDLMGAGRWQPARNWRPFVTFPVPGASWDLPVSGWHYDMPFDPEETRGVPAINVFAFLAPVLPAGGGTVVLAGSHHLVRRYTTSNPEGGQVHSPAMKATLGSAHPWLNGLWTRGSDVRPKPLSAGRRGHRRSAASSRRADRIPRRSVPDELSAAARTCTVLPAHATDDAHPDDRAHRFADAVTGSPRCRDLASGCCQCAH